MDMATTTKKDGDVLGIKLDAETWGDLIELAERESRPTSNMARILISEAISAREAAGKKEKK